MKRVAAILCATMLGAGAAQADALKLLAGQPGSDAYALAGAVQRIFEKHLPEHVLQVHAGAAAGNIRAIEEGRADFAITFSMLAVDAVEGRPPFKEKAQDLCHVASFLDNAFHIVTRADSEVKSPGDLRGKAAALRPRGTVVEQVTRAVLEAHKLTYADFGRIAFGTRSDGVAQMKEGEAEIFVMAAPVPATAIRDIAAARQIRLVGLDPAAIERLQATNRGYRKVSIEANTYPMQDSAARTVGFVSHLVARCSLGEETAHAAARALVAEFGEVAAVSREAARLKPADLAAEAEIPFHPGALRAFREAKLR